MYISTPAMAAVTRNVATVTPMILPARRALFILAMAEAIEQNTMGTTTQNIMLMNSVPRNSILPPKLGANAPTRQPATMPVSIHRMNQ